jgi:glyoxylase-like metal-dependent hydrolase (beta-lactamase superfamily II)
MSRDAAIQLAPNVWRIPTLVGDFINSFAFVDDDGSVTLVDTGLAKAPPRIVAGLEAMGKHPRDVVRILLTHVHPDHAGGAAEMSRLTGVPVQVHDDDRPSAVAGTIVNKPDQRFLSGRLVGRLPAGGFPRFDPGEPLTDGQVLDVGGGLRVVHTPGHSPGHVSFLHEETRTLITGDAIFNVFWLRGIHLSPRALCSDFMLTRKTAHRLAELEYDVAAFTHGTDIRDNPREKIRDYLRSVED